LRPVLVGAAIALVLAGGLLASVALPGLRSTPSTTGVQVSVNTFLLSRSGPMAKFLDVAHSPQNASIRPSEVFALNLTLAFPKTSDEGDTSTDATALVVTVSLSTPNFSLVRLSYFGLNDNLARVVVNADSGVQLQAWIRGPSADYSGPLAIDLNTNRFP